MARVARQGIPQPPDHYDQAYIAKLADALNRYMFQRAAPGEITAAHFICTDPVSVTGDLPDTSTLATGTLYLAPTQAASGDTSVYGQAWASGSITLTTAPQAIPGCSLTLTRAGIWLLIMTFDFNCANEQGAYLYGQVSGFSHLAVADTGSNTGRVTVGNQAIVNATLNQAVSLSAYKTGGNGNSSTGLETSLSAVWIPGAPSPNNFFTVVTPQDA